MKYHFVGIGGIGMSGVAQMMLAAGHDVSGSDLSRSEIISLLEKKGAQIFIGHEGRHVEGADCVVYSSSIKKDQIEILWARERNIPVIHRSEALADICRGKFTVAVSGTHGKTTTTALVGMILKEAEREPSIVVGGIVEDLGGNAMAGKGKEIVIEADESDGTFLNFSPDLAILTNIEAEHLDHFENFENVKSAFCNFLQRLTADGRWIGCAEDSAILEMACEDRQHATLYGFDSKTADFWASDIVECPDNQRGLSFTAWMKDERLGSVRMKIVGRHNVLNALAAISAGISLDIPFEVIARALGRYRGAKRRFDVRYEDSEVLLVDDYAHHPTEIRKTLLAAKALHRKRIVTLFQPHRYTRTEALLQEFGQSFEDTDKLIVTDIYAASEAPRPGISGESLCRVVKEKGHKDVTFVKREILSDYAKHEIRSGDLVIALGAGDIYQAAYEISEYLRENSIFSELKGKVIFNEPLSRHTSLRVGGPAQVWIEPVDLDDLKKSIFICKKHGKSIFVVGAGSNILARDSGYQGVVIHLGGAFFKEIRCEKGQIIAGAGVPNTLFIQYALENGFGGCEFLSGIPGNIGGAIAMNAGSHGQSVEEILVAARVVDRSGNEFLLTRDELGFGYRRSTLGDRIIVGGIFSLPQEPRDISQKRLDEYRQYRASTQDLWHASAGCMFKNPDKDCSSGKMIDQAGLKGKIVGRAQVSEKHANFIINLGGATAADVLTLIDEVRESVRRHSGVTLETEVKIL